MPGLSFSTIDYVAQGTAAGEELANCINERYDGKADVLFAESAPGTAGKEELEDAVKAALAAGAPDAEIVTTITVSDRTAAQTDIGAALQGNPDVTAVFGQNDEGALGTIGAFKAAGKDIPCITEAGGNDEALAAVETGDIYAVGAPAVRGRPGPVRRHPHHDDRGPRGDRRPADGPPGSREGRGLIPP